MTIIWKDTTLRLHGKRHRRDCYYFRWHYGKQRVVQISGEYVDKPTEAQVSAREAFTALRREVARQLRDAELRSAWMRKFEEDNEGYKMLHTYVYAKMKKSPLQLPPQGERCVAEDKATETTEATRTSMRRGNALVSTSRTEQKFRSAEVQRFRDTEVQRFERGCVVDEGDAINGVSTPKWESNHALSNRETPCMASLQMNNRPILILWKDTITPLFLPSKVPRERDVLCCCT